MGAGVGLLAPSVNSRRHCDAWVKVAGIDQCFLEIAEGLTTCRGGVQWRVQACRTRVHRS
jgi:hypothetical protein